MLRSISRILNPAFAVSIADQRTDCGADQSSDWTIYGPSDSCANRCQWLHKEGKNRQYYENDCHADSSSETP